MKYSVRNAFNHIVTMGLVAVGLFATTACNPEPDESDLYTSTGKTTLDFIKEDPNLSSFLYIMERVGLDKNLAAYGQYTCFIPNNQAVATYINDLYNDDKATVPHNSMTENSLQGLTDSLCNDIAKYHLAIGLYPTLNINPTIPMMLGRSINTETTSDSEGRVTINHVAGMQAGAVIVDGDHEMCHRIIFLPFVPVKGVPFGLPLPDDVLQCERGRAEGGLALLRQRFQTFPDGAFRAL